jgi:hypothetical protein
VKEEATELEYLRWYKMNAESCFGYEKVAKGFIDRTFERETGKLVPFIWRSE